jgi:hypothetical protein
MIRHSIRLTSFIFALFTFILIFQYTISEQQRLPFDTTTQFELNISQSHTPKEELVDSLNELTNRNEGVLVKVVADPVNYQSKKDVIWFGYKKPVSKNVIVDNQKIYWFDSKLTGELIPSTDIGTRPLYGTYAMRGSDKFRSTITQWACENGITISWVAQSSALKIAYNCLIQNGIGNAVITAFVLFLTTIIAWFVTHAKARTIRLLGGVSSKRIHAEDTISIMTIVVSGFLIAWILILGYVAFVNGIRQISLILLQSFVSLILLLLLSNFFTVLISILVRSKTEYLASRKIPLKRFRQLGTATCIISIVLALLIIPSTMTSAYILQQLSKDYSLWENMQNNVSLSFGDIDSLETEKMLPNVESFFNDMEQNSNLCLSLAIDKAILLNKEEYGGYDHIIITDRTWLHSFNIGVGTAGKGGKLTKINFEKLKEPLQSFLNAQMPLWTNTGEVQPAGVGFYEFTGDKFLALPPNVGYGGSTIQAKDPLVILIDNPASILKTKNFMLPAASSGNVVFQNNEILRSALSTSPIKEYIVSIDTVADVALEQAQKFAKQAVFYIMACILIFVAIIFAGIMNAQLWVSSNKKRIFTLHTAGKPYNEIIQPSFRKELIIAMLTVAIGCIISFIIRRPEPITLISVAFAIALLYDSGNLVAYQVCARQVFYQMSRRND